MEHAFWQAITADPRDRLPRLVFADWLADHGRYLTEEAARATIEKYPEPRVAGNWVPTLNFTGYNARAEWYWLSAAAKIAAFPVNRHFTIPHAVWEALPGKPQWCWYKRFPDVKAAFGELWTAWLAVHHPDAMVDCLDPVNLFAAER